MIAVSDKTKLLIFDCDGTIANNMPIHIFAWETILNKYGLKISGQNLDKYHGMNSQFILSKLYNLSNEKIDKIANEISELIFINIDKAQPIQPTIDIIKKYHNKIPMVVISGGTKINVIKTLKSLNILNMFDDIITADDQHPAKNTTEAFTLIADKYNIKYSACHVFEDGVPGLINALKAGMTVTDMRNIDL